MADPVLGAAFGAVGNIISSAINAGVQKKLVRETNETNKQIADAANQTALQNTLLTNDTNIEIADKNNAAARELADLEYERNSIAGKFQQYIDAGFSEMQAKQLAAGAQAGEYSAPQLQQATAVAPPAPAVPTMQTPNVTPPDVSGLGGLGSLISDFTAPDGGTLGALSGRDVTAEIYKHMSEFPEDIYTTQDFAKWMQLQPDDSWCKDPDFVANFNNMFKYLPGQRYFNSFLNQQYQFRDKKQQIEYRSNEIKMQYLQQTLTDLQISQADLDLCADMLDYEMKQQVQPYLTEANIERFKKEAAEFSRDYGLYHNEEYRKQWFDNMCKEESNKAIFLTIEQLKKQGMLDAGKTNPELIKVVSLYQYYHDCGIDSNWISSLVLGADAFGLIDLNTISKYEQEVVNDLSDASNSLVEKFKRFVESKRNEREGLKKRKPSQITGGASALW